MEKLKSILLTGFLIMSVTVFSQSSKKTNTESLAPSVKTKAITQKKVKSSIKSNAKLGDALRVNARKKSINEWLNNNKTKKNN